MPKSKKLKLIYEDEEDETDGVEPYPQLQAIIRPSNYVDQRVIGNSLDGASEMPGRATGIEIKLPTQLLQLVLSKWGDFVESVSESNPELGNVAQLEVGYCILPQCDNVIVLDDWSIEDYMIKGDPGKKSI